MIAVDGLALPEQKTKQMAAILHNLGATRTCLVVLHDKNPELWRCTRNIQGAAMVVYRDLNAYEMIRPRRVIFTLEAIGRFLAEAAAAKTPDRPVGVSDNG